MKPKATYLAYSAGVQSQCILEMVLRGHIERPDNFCAIRADPGMEDGRSQEFVDVTRKRCEAAGFPLITAEGPNLYSDLILLPFTGQIRNDNPPYWTKNRKTGKIGKLKQKCTIFYKIQPMRRALRVFMHERLGTSLVSTRLPQVEAWVGFASDESARVKNKKKDAKYISVRYPLIELGMNRAAVEGYYIQHNIPKPPRSVCNACFSNGLAYYEDMYLNRPDDWDKAVRVDEAVRDMSTVGITDEVFVFSGCIPLRDLPGRNFKKFDPDYREHRCNSGHCYL